MRGPSGTWTTILTMLLLLGAIELAGEDRAESERPAVAVDGSLTRQSIPVVAGNSDPVSIGGAPVVAANDKVHYIAPRRARPLLFAERFVEASAKSRFLQISRPCNSSQAAVFRTHQRSSPKESPKEGQVSVF